MIARFSSRSLSGYKESGRASWLYSVANREKRWWAVFGRWRHLYIAWAASGVWGSGRGVGNIEKRGGVIDNDESKRSYYRATDQGSHFVRIFVKIERNSREL